MDSPFDISGNNYHPMNWRDPETFHYDASLEAHNTMIIDLILLGIFVGVILMLAGSLAAWLGI